MRARFVAWRLSAGAALLAVCTATPAAGLDVSDDLQRTVSLDRPAARVVSLAPHLTELLHSAGAGDKLVGVSRHCDYPPTVTALPKVSDYTTINYELITELQPDLILVWNAGLKDAALRKLVSLYRNVYVSNPAGFEGVAENLVEIGTLTGSAAHARQAADVFLREIDDLAARHTRPQPVKALYLIWHDPLMTVGADHWISRALGVCGGVNIFADAIADVVRLNRESLQLRPADVILRGMETPANPNHSAALERALGPAAGKAPVRYIQDDLIQRPSLRLVQGTASMCRALHRQ